MGQPSYCWHCGNRLHPPANVHEVRCHRCGNENRLRPSGPADPLAALTEAPNNPANIPSQPSSAALTFPATTAVADDDDSQSPTEIDFREANPFADDTGGIQPATPQGAGQEVNPYAPPAAVSPPSADDFMPASARVGLPWQNESTIRSWFATAIRVAFFPSIAFRQMRLDDDYNGAISFSVLGALGGWGIVICVIGAFLIATIPGYGLDPGTGRSVVIILGTLVGQLLCGGIGVAIGVAIGVLVWAALYHVGLSALGANRNGFGTTVQIVGFTHGAMFCALPLLVIPFVSIVPWIWSMVVLVIGLREAHQTTTAKSILSVVMPTVVLSIAISAVVLYRMGVGPFGIPTR